MHKVSVIVPVYNVKKYLDECIKSICAQSYPELQILLIDDGSSDGSEGICDDWNKKDSRIEVIHLKNGGVSNARNVGLKNAVGEYVCFVDSDDYIDEKHIENLVEIHTDTQLSACGICLLFERDGRKKQLLLGPESVVEISKIDISQFYACGLLNSPVNKLYETKLIKDNGLQFDSKVSLGEDALFNIEYLKVCSGNIRVLNEPTYFYIQHGNETLNNKYREDYFDIQKLIFGEVIKYLESNYAPYETVSFFRRKLFCGLVVAIDNLYQNKDTMKPEDFKRKMNDIILDNEFSEQISKMMGKDRTICSVRYFFIRHKGYVLDYTARNIAKKILGFK